MATATYIPAAVSRVVPGRGGASVSFAVIARAGDARDTADSASALNVISKYVSEGTAAPHFFVGSAGELVQFIDMDATSRILPTSAQATTFYSTASTVLDQLVDVTIDYCAIHEMNQDGYGSINPNDAGKGMSYGFIQFNQSGGSLGLLLRAMYDADPDFFKSTFGAATSNLIDREWVKDFSRNNLMPYYRLLQVAASNPKMQAVQRKLAKSEYWDPAAAAAQQIGLDSQRAFAVFFDAAVQHGTPWVGSNLIASVKRDDPDRLRKIAEIADARAKEKRNRRQSLFYDPVLSDAPLSDLQLTNTHVSLPAVSNATSVVIMLEGRTNDSVTAGQRNTVARILRTMSSAMGLGLTTSQVFGLDMTAASGRTSRDNPGPNFFYVDLLGGAKLSEADSFVTEFNPTAEAVKQSAAILASQLQEARTKGGIPAMAVLLAYEDVAGVRRAQASSYATRKSHYTAAHLETNTRQLRESYSDVRLGVYARSVGNVPNAPDGTVRGLQFDFVTGLWSDGKPGGRIA